MSSHDRSDGKKERQRSLAQALRQNLRRRKRRSLSADDGLRIRQADRDNRNRGDKGLG